jgi:intergrase/recombinase
LSFLSWLLLNERTVRTAVYVERDSSPTPFSSHHYYNPERQTLEHFRFPEIFLRRTKKAYIFFITLDNLQPIATLGCKTPTPGYNAIRHACGRAGIACDLHFCRKIFASHLRQEGIQPEVVDMLQGRVSQSVLTRHYLTPSHDLKDKVLDSLDRLKQAISQCE